MTIGEALKNHRVTQQMSQEEVATKILVTRTSISNWETGKTVPDSLNLLKLSTLYGCSVDELLKKERAGMKKNFRTMTYGAGLKDGTMRLKIETDASKFFPKGVEVKASVDLETGEVTFFVEQEEMKKLKAATDEK
ncbi:helix-turn-helix domain-containing protein [Enterococcus casseliflavus]|uniref:helix-turn-helix domain-containing protein n=1 Tax=Enterococcus TaxID=1350 RepID=UPI0039A4F2B3